MILIGIIKQIQPRHKFIT